MCRDPGVEPNLHDAGLPGQKPWITAHAKAMIFRGVLAATCVGRKLKFCAGASARSFGRHRSVFDVDTWYDGPSFGERRWSPHAFHHLAGRPGSRGLDTVLDAV